MRYEQYENFSTRSQVDQEHVTGSTAWMPVLTIATHPHPLRIGEQHIWRRGNSLAISRTEPMFARDDRLLGDPLGQPSLSRKPISLIRTGQGFLLKRETHSGQVWVDGVALEDTLPITEEMLGRGVAIDLSRRVLLFLHRVVLEKKAPPAMGMVGNSAAMCQLRSEIQRLAGIDVPVLIRGETGTGKELVASALHEQSGRLKGPFVAVNMAGLSENLATAELFGATRGAFSGAVQPRQGYLQAADGGTLFLDEIGETPLALQPMLLRALEAREVVPVGDHRPRKVDIRLISATDANLEQLCDEGQFKQPLLHRIATCELRIPPLRERRADICPLLLHFARPVLAQIGMPKPPVPEDPYGFPWLPTTLAARLLSFSWPGNIRQCRNLASELVIACAGQPVLSPTPRLESLFERVSELQDACDKDAAPKRKPGDIGEDELIAAMERCAWEPKAASELLGISRASMYNLINQSPHLHTALDLDEAPIREAHRQLAGDLDAMCAQLCVSKNGLKRRLKGMGLDAT